MNLSTASDQPPVERPRVNVDQLVVLQPQSTWKGWRLSNCFPAVIASRHSCFHSTVEDVMYILQRTARERERKFWENTDFIRCYMSKNPVFEDSALPQIDDFSVWKTVGKITCFPWVWMTILWPKKPSSDRGFWLELVGVENRSRETETWDRFLRWVLNRDFG